MNNAIKQMNKHEKTQISLKCMTLPWKQRTQQSMTVKRTFISNFNVYILMFVIYFLF